MGNRYCAATADDCPAIRLMGTLPKKLSVVKTTCGPDETECPAGCCPEANWFCCPDNRYCAATADDCPAIKLPSLLPKKLSVVKTTCGPDELECQVDVAHMPAGSAVLMACIVPPILLTAHKKLPTIPRKLNVIKPPCGPDETECPAGCCSEANWFCCPNNRYCPAKNS